MGPRWHSGTQIGFSIGRSVCGGSGGRRRVVFSGLACLCGVWGADAGYYVDHVGESG